MVLTPAFDKGVTEYSATTSNASNTVTAVAENPSDTVEITANDVEIESGDAVTWEVGENTVEVTVTDKFTPTTKTYTVTVTKLSSAKAITSFVIGTAEGVISEEDHTIAVEVEAGTDVTALQPTIEVSEGAEVSPASGAEADFTDPVTYTVTAEDETTQEYEVTVTVGE